MIFFTTSRHVIARIGAVALAFLAAVLSHAAARKTQEERPPEIIVNSDWLERDFKKQVLYLRGDVIITYGKMTVRADRAVATNNGDYTNSRWTLDGNVRMNAVPRGNLRSDQAIIEVGDKQLKRATATGKPAEFDQTGEDSNVIAHGHAKEIVYEVGEGTVRLSNDASVTYGPHDITAPEITYSLRDERVQATTSPGTGRIQVTIEPNESPKDGKDGSGTNKPKPAVPPDSGKQQAPATPQAAAQQAAPQASPAQPATPPPSAPPAMDGTAAAASSQSPPGTSPPPRLQSTPPH